MEYEDSIKLKRHKYYLANKEKFSKRYFDRREHFSNYNKVYKKTREYHKIASAKLSWAKRLYYYCKAKNKSKYNILVDFDVQYIEELYKKQNGKCYWFNLQLDVTARLRNSLKPSIDRLDNTKGYTKDNIVLCSTVANLGRSTMEVSEWLEVIKLIKESI